MSRSKYKTGEGYGYEELVADVAHILRMDRDVLSEHMLEMWGYTPYDGADMSIMCVLNHPGSGTFEVRVNEDGSGSYRFSAALPDGRVLWSEWVNVPA